MAQLAQVISRLTRSDRLQGPERPREALCESYDNKAVVIAVLHSPEAGADHL